MAPGSSSAYEVTVTRDGGWWMVRIPALSGLTQARRLADAGLMAREWIALTLDVPLGEVDVTVTVDRIGTVEVARRVAAIRDQRARAAQLDLQATAQAAGLARELAGAGVTVRDIGTALGVSFQRAHQLTKSRQ